MLGAKADGVINNMKKVRWKDIEPGQAFYWKEELLLKLAEGYGVLVIESPDAHDLYTVDEWVDEGDKEELELYEA